MSDCSTNAWGIPRKEDRERGVLYMHPTYSKKFYEGLKAIEVNGVRFERVTEPKRKRG